MGIVWTVISGFFVRLFGLNLGAEILKWIAFRGLMLTLFVAVMPIIFHNLLIWSMRFGGAILQRYIQLQGGSVDFQAQVLTVTGVGGYLCNCLQIPQVFSIYMTALSARFALNMLARLPVGRII